MKTIKEKPFNYISSKHYSYLTEEDKLELFNHYHNGDLNQFFLIIIMKVLEKKTFTLDNHNVILGSLVKYANYDFSDFRMDEMEDVLRFAGFIYTRFMIIDITEIDISGF